MKPIVVHLSSVHFVFDTRIFVKECQSLAKAGYDVHLIAQSERDEIIEGVKIQALPIVKSKVERLTKVIPALWKKARKYPKGSVFHFHDPELIPIGLLLKTFGYKVIYDVHEDVPKDLLTKEWIPKPFRLVLSKVVQFIEQISSPFFNGIVTVVPTITDRFKTYNKRVSEVRNFPITNQIEQSKQSSEACPPYVIYVGSLTSRRGIPKLVDAISLVKNKEVQLWLGGDFAEKGLEELVKSKEGWKRTRFLGWVSHDQIEGILKNALCGLLTLELIPSHNESYNVKLFEYMRSEIPVISTNLLFPSQIISQSESGIVLEQHNPEQIAQAVGWLLEHPKEASEMGKNGKKAVLSSYSWSNEEKVLYELYRSME